MEKMVIKKIQKKITESRQTKIVSKKSTMKMNVILKKIVTKNLYHIC